MDQPPSDKDKDTEKDKPADAPKANEKANENVEAQDAPQENNENQDKQETQNVGDGGSNKEDNDDTALVFDDSDKEKAEDENKGNKDSNENEDSNDKNENNQEHKGKEDNSNDAANAETSNESKNNENVDQNENSENAGGGKDAGNDAPVEAPVEVPVDAPVDGAASKAEDDNGGDKAEDNSNGQEDNGAASNDKEAAYNGGDIVDAPVSSSNEKNDAGAGNAVEEKNEEREKENVSNENSKNGNGNKEDVDENGDEDDDDEEEEDEYDIEEIRAEVREEMSKELNTFKEQLVMLQKQLGLKEREILNLKRSFTDISRQQKEVFIEVDAKRKSAMAAGKKYKKQCAQLQSKCKQLQNDLKANAGNFDAAKRQNSSLQSEIRSLKQNRSENEKKLEMQLNKLKESLMSSEQTKHEMANEMSKTQSAIGQLLEVDEMNAKLTCDIECKDEEPTNLSVLKLRFPNLPKAMKKKSEIEIRWFRSHFNDMLLIEGATSEEYHVCADDIGCVLKGEVRSVKLKDCYSSAVIGPIRLSHESKNKVHESLGRIIKKEIEFSLSPDLTDSKTAETLKGAKQVILHFNRDKVKIRDSKNHTFEKEIYNRQMRVSLMASNPLQFKLKLKRNKEYSFLAKSVSERDDIAILLRAYYMQLENAKDPKLKLSFYLRLANENDLGLRNGLVKPGDTLLSRDALVRNILAPISSKRSYGNGVQPPLSENSLNSAPRSTQLAPVSNGPELSVSALSGQDTYDADALFPSDMFDVGATGLDSVRGGSSARMTSGPGSPNAGVLDDFFAASSNGDSTFAKTTSTDSNAQQQQQQQQQSGNDSPKKSRKHKKKRSKEKGNGDGAAPATSGTTGSMNGNDVSANSENTEETEDGQSNNEETKKVWKGLQLAEKGEEVSDDKLRSISFGAAPAARNSKPKKGKKKKKKRKSKKNEESKEAEKEAPPAADATPADTTSQVEDKKGVGAGTGVAPDVETQAQGSGQVQIQIDAPAETAVSEIEDKADKSLGISAVMEDRVDCLMSLSGDIAKFQIVGSLSLHFAHKLTEDRILTLKLFNLPNTKIFNPKRVKQTVDEDIIKVKCVKDDESINVAKYKWKCDDPSQVCPLKMSLKYENSENDCVVTCHVEKQSNLGDVSVCPLTILGTIAMDNENGKITQIVETEPKKMEISGCEFHWSKEMAHKYMFKLSDDSCLKDGRNFVCKFSQEGGKVSTVTVKPTFEINDFGLSTITVIGGVNPNDRMIENGDNKRRVISGDYQITNQS